MDFHYYRWNTASRRLERATICDFGSGENILGQEVLVEFRHQPTKVQLQTLVTPRYKMTVYRDHNYGELFDLEVDPDERRNLWDDTQSAGIKAEMMRQMVNAELRRQPVVQPRIAGA